MVLRLRHAPLRPVLLQLALRYRPPELRSTMGMYRFGASTFATSCRGPITARLLGHLRYHLDCATRALLGANSASLAVVVVELVSKT